MAATLSYERLERFSKVHRFFPRSPVTLELRAAFLLFPSLAFPHSVIQGQYPFLIPIHDVRFFFVLQI